MTLDAMLAENAALYGRLSREDVDGRHAGCDSIAVQTRDGTKAIRAERWAFDPDRHIFVDDDVSGTTLHRRGWDALLAAAKRGEFQILVVRDQDRIARYEPARAMMTLLQLRDMGVRVWCYKDRAFPPLDGFESILTYVKAITAQQYVESIRHNVTAKLDLLAADGRPTNRPSFGYRIAKGADGKRWEIDPDKVATVHRVAACFIETRSYFGASNLLNAEGLRASKGGPWSPQAVQQLLQRPIYRGVYEKGRRSSRGAEAVQVIPHPELRIWTDEEEAELDRILARPSRPWDTTPRHLATRAVRCGLCGGRLIACRSKRSKGMDVFCNSRRYGGCGGIGRKKEAAVDAAIVRTLADFLNGDIWAETMTIVADALHAEREADDREAEVARLRREVATTAKRVASLTEAVAEAADRTARSLLLDKLGPEADRLEKMRVALRRAEAAPAPADPAEILREAERGVEDLRAGLARGGGDAFAAVGAILGPRGKFIARREGNDWHMTASASLAGLFVPSSGTRGRGGRHTRSRLRFATRSAG